MFHVQKQQDSVLQMTVNTTLNTLWHAEGQFVFLKHIFILVKVPNGPYF